MSERTLNPDYAAALSAFEQAVQLLAEAEQALVKAREVYAKALDAMNQAALKENK